MSFHEKSAWVCLLGISVVYIPYFVVVLRFPMAALLAVHWLFAGFVVANLAYYAGIVWRYRRIASA